MRRSFATTFSLTRVPATAVGLVLMPLVTSAVAAAPEIGAPATPSTSSPPVIEMQEDAPGKAGHCTGQEACPAGPDVASERAYLVATSRAGGTMMRQGPEVAISRLHPEFVMRLAAAIREAREQGLPEAGIFSAYRPPAFGIGGFKDKFDSLHSYGLATDITGIGGPGSTSAHRWHQIVTEVGLYLPYGPDHRVEFNHTQFIPMKVAPRELRETITADGPIDLRKMWLASGDD